MCATAKKNEVRANELYRGRVVSAKGKFGMIKVSGKYYPHVDFRTQNFHVTLDMNKKTEPWKQYDDGQVVDSGNVKVSKVSVTSWGGLNAFDHCIIGE